MGVVLMIYVGGGYVASLTAIKFRVQNYRNVDDSGWVALNRITALVGRNESGKTAILKALHKFNPADAESFMAQYEFPRYRYTSDFKSKPDKPWPVTSVEFGIDDELREALRTLLEEGQDAPKTVTITRYYPADPSKSPYSTRYSFAPNVIDPDVPLKLLVDVLRKAEKDARLITAATEGAEDQVRALREQLSTWVSGLLEVTKSHQKETSSLRDVGGVELVERVLQEATAKMSEAAKPALVPIIEEMTEVRDLLSKPPAANRLWEEVKKHIPVFIYFENYGILQDEIYLPRFVEDLTRKPNDPATRTRHALFRHVRLSPQEINELGKELAPSATAQGEPELEKAIGLDEAKKHERSVQLSSASQDITDRFTRWYKQRRHTFRYQADGNYFRIWVSDDKRRDEIELQARSKGLQWFFSFYLVFLVESDYGHKDSILLLDEPGLHLHPTAQQELITFMEELSEKNQLVYTTHMPFLIDGDHLHRVRPVAEDEKGLSHVMADIWPPDRDTIFPLQAALGYSMMQTLFEGKRNVLAEGLSELFYIKALSLQLRAAGREGLAEDIFITPCRGTKMIGHMASLYLGQGLRPLVLLDADDAGRARYKSLLDTLYQQNRDHLLLLSEVLSQQDCEIEDLIGDDSILPAVSELLGNTVKLEASDRARSTVVGRVEAWANRNSFALPDGWRGLVAYNIVTKWSTMKPEQLPHGLLDRAEKLINELNQRTPKPSPTIAGKV